MDAAYKGKIHGLNLRFSSTVDAAYKGKIHGLEAIKRIFTRILLFLMDFQNFLQTHCVFLAISLFHFVVKMNEKLHDNVSGAHVEWN